MGSLDWAMWPMPDAEGTGPNAASYTITDGVVIDDVTGLMWQRIVTETFADSQEQAIATCEALELEGISDWRVPGVLELVSILKYGGTPAIDADVFPNTPPWRYWTWMRSVKDGAYWAVDSQSGFVQAYVSLSAMVRCVRSSEGTLPTHYTTSSGVVRDNWTGLEWPAAPATSNVLWEDAPAYCQGLDLEGSGWRVPSSPKELQTIVDRSRFGPAIDPSIFPSVGTTSFWTSLPSGTHTTWNLTTYLGSTTSAASSSAKPVWCVR